MSLAVPKKQPTSVTDETTSRVGRLKRLLPSWEIYVILLTAGFLRLYQLGTSEFDADQAAIFGLAREAVRAGLLPIVSNRASIGIENPPLVIYLLMIPAAISANPLWAVAMVALLNILAVFLTYIFTRRYYGRFAAIVAALLYAAAAKPLNYSRFIWQQNMLAPIVVLFVFALFWGVVERRKGWLFPALLLLGLAYQLHETALLLAIPLLVAVLLVPRTLRWRDLALALISLLLVFSPYILWEITTHFSDLSIVLGVMHQHSHVKSDVINLYKFFLSPYGFGSYDQLPSSPNALLRQFATILFELRYLLLLLLIAGLTTATLMFLFPEARVRRDKRRMWTWMWGPGRPHSGNDEGSPRPVESSAPQPGQATGSHLRFISLFAFRAEPYRCGLLVLLAWQIVPLLIFSRQTLPLYPYYLLILMPGPFILMGLFLARVITFVPHHRWYWQGLRLGIYAITVFTLLAQVLTCTATLIDSANGTNGHGTTFNDLGSLQHALQKADQLALQRHLKHIYITTDQSSQTAMSYLAAQLQTPTTLFDDQRCFVLPSFAAGPAVMLVSPYAQLTLALLGNYAALNLIDRPARLGAPPFQLYIVSPRPHLAQAAASQAFTDNLQLLNVQQAQLNLTEPSWLISQWNLLRSASPAPRVTYNYALTAFIKGNKNDPRHSVCLLTALHAGDQLFVAFDLHDTAQSFHSVTLEGQSYITTPINPSFGPLHTETDHLQHSPCAVLRTTEGKDSITFSLT